MKELFASIGNKSVNVPINIREMGLVAKYNNGNKQPSLSVSNGVFALDGYRLVYDLFTNGSAFTKVPFEISDKDGYILFDGYLDFSESPVFNPDKKVVEVKIVTIDDIVSLDKEIEGLTFGYLSSLTGFKGDFNVFYKVEIEGTGFEFALTAFMAYTMYVELKRTATVISKDVAIISSFLTPTPPVTAPAASAAVYAALSIALNAAFAAFIVVYLIKLITQLVNSVYPFIRSHKASRVKTLLELVCTQIGLKLNTSIEELNSPDFDLVLLPSNPNNDLFSIDGVISNQGTIKNGIPNVNDFGYNCRDLFESCAKLFNAKYVVRNGFLEFHWKYSNFWKTFNGLTIAETANPAFEFNSKDLKGTKLFSFQTDVSDVFTSGRTYKGTSLQVNTRKSILNNGSRNSINGYERVNFDFALGDVTTSNTALEQSIIDLCTLINDVVSIFGGSFNPNNILKQSRGALRVGNNNHTVPKLLLYKKGELLGKSFSAKYLYEKYYLKDSFVNGIGQKKIFSNIKIPFGVKDWKLALYNNVINNNVEIESLTWNFTENNAIITYSESIKYDNLLTETLIEP